MITRDDVKRIATLASDAGILSAYVKIDPRLRYEPQQPAAKFKGAIKRLARAADAWRRAVLDREAPRVLDYLGGLDANVKGRGLAVFSSAPAGIWEVAELDVMVPTTVQVEKTTSTALLAQVLDEWPRFVVTVAQKDSAAVYLVEQRAAAEVARVESEVPGVHDEGGWSQARYQRHIESHTREHLQQVAEELKRLFYDRGFNYLTIGGTLEAVNQLVEMLDDQVRRRLIGAFSVDFKHTTEEQVLEQARELLQEKERQAERELVERIQGAAASGGAGALGLEATIQAIVEGRVDVLAVAEGAQAPGSMCPDCEYFAAGRLDRCPVCASETERTPNIVDYAVERAFLARAHVETLFGDARARLLQRGGVGALLRY